MKTAIRYFSHSGEMAAVTGEMTGVKPQPVADPMGVPVEMLYLGCGVMLGMVRGEMAAFIHTPTPDRYVSARAPSSSRQYRRYAVFSRRKAWRRTSVRSPAGGAMASPPCRAFRQARLR